MKAIDIPPFLSHLRVDDRGYPVPFFVPWKDGIPQFLYMDQKKQELSMERNLCHICGKKLNKDYAYVITGPVGLMNRVVSDPPMHRECAEFSLAVCPHMLYHRAERKTDEAPASIHVKEKPTHLFLIRCSKWKAKFEPTAGYKLIHFTVAGTEKYIYIDNKLQKELS